MRGFGEVDKDGVLKINMRDLVDAMSDETRAELCRYLTADEVLFGAVLDCVVDGDFHGTDAHGSWWLSGEETAKLRAKLLPMMPQVARDLVRELMQERDRARDMERHYREETFRLYHAWPDSYLRDRPSLTRDFPSTGFVSDEAAQAALNERASDVEPAP